MASGWRWRRRAVTPRPGGSPGLRFEAGPTRSPAIWCRMRRWAAHRCAELASPNVTTAAALLLVDATGSADASITLTRRRQTERRDRGIVATSPLSDIASAPPTFRRRYADLFGVPAIDGTISGRAIAAGGISVDTLDARATRNGDATAFDLQAALANRHHSGAGGSLAPLDEGYRLALDRAELTQGSCGAARAADGAADRRRYGRARCRALRCRRRVGSPRPARPARSSISRSTSTALPLSIANAIAPDLRLAGRSTARPHHRHGLRSAAPASPSPAPGIMRLQRSANSASRRSASPPGQLRRRHGDARRRMTARVPAA